MEPGLESILTKFKPQPNSHGRQFRLLLHRLPLLTNRLPTPRNLIPRQPQTIILNTPDIVQVEFVRRWCEGIVVLCGPKYE